MDVSKILSSLIGEELTDRLEKNSQIFKPNVQVAVSLEEIAWGLKIVPKAVLKWLSIILHGMRNGEHKEVKIPWHQNAVLKIDKKDQDTYSGLLMVDNKPIEYMHRSLPGVGLILLSNLELYNQVFTEDETAPAKELPNITEEFQRLMDEQIRIKHLVECVVEQKLTQREAIEQIVANKIRVAIPEKKEIKLPEPVKVEEKIEAPVKIQEIQEVIPEITQKKAKALKSFLSSREAKKNKLKFSIPVSFGKCENIQCPDCQQDITKSGSYVGCICFGEDCGNKVLIKKQESRTDFFFDKSWDEENIEMLLNIFKKELGA